MEMLTSLEFGLVVLGGVFAGSLFYLLVDSREFL